MTRKDKILWCVVALEIAALVPLSVVTYLARTDEPEPVFASVNDSGKWIQTDRTFLDKREETYFYTCPGNGRQEGTVQSTAEGMWFATSEHESHDWDRVKDTFRTKELAQQAIERFVSHFNMCR